QQSRTDGGSEHEMGRNGEARGVGEDAEARTDHGAEAEAAVQGGVEGAPAELLDVGPFDVHGDLAAAHPAAEQGQPERGHERLPGLGAELAHGEITVDEW